MPVSRPSGPTLLTVAAVDGGGRARKVDGLDRPVAGCGCQTQDPGGELGKRAVTASVHACRSIKTIRVSASVGSREPLCRNAVGALSMWGLE